MSSLFQAFARRLGRVAHQANTGWPIEQRPAPQPAAHIPGAFAAPELCMLPVDVGASDMPRYGKQIAQLKVDGIRAPYLHRRILTREGGPLDCALHCQPGLARLEAAFGEPMMFDTEYSEEAGFNATIAAMRRGGGQGVCWIFDAVPMREWLNDSCITPIELRFERLREHVMAADSPFVGMLDSWTVTPADALAKARELWAEGYEGLVLKRPGSLYQRRRSPDWRRLKQTITHEGPIIDAMAKNGELKALVVRSPDGPVRCASGWAVQEGREIHDVWLAVDPESRGALFAEVTYQRSTGRTRSIRGARFIRLRHDIGRRS